MQQLKALTFTLTSNAYLIVLKEIKNELNVICIKIRQYAYYALKVEI